jgi:hypothetical protein
MGPLGVETGQHIIFLFTLSRPALQQHTALSKQLGHRKDRCQLPRTSWKLMALIRNRKAANARKGDRCRNLSHCKHGHSLHDALPQPLRRPGRARGMKHRRRWVRKRNRQRITAHAGRLGRQTKRDAGLGPCPGCQGMFTAGIGPVALSET